MPTCNHGLPLTLQPILFVRQDPDDEHEELYSLRSPDLEQARRVLSEIEHDLPGAHARIAFGAIVKSRREAKRYGAQGVATGDGGSFLAIYEPGTKDASCPYGDCDGSAHSVHCGRCGKPLAVNVHDAGLPA